MLGFCTRIFRAVAARANVIKYKLLYRLYGRRVIWGDRVRINGKFIVKGPGTVILGGGTYINGSGHPVTPFTHSRDAVIEIGGGSFVNGTRFGCAKRISIGKRCVLADARIMDTDFHAVDPDARLREEPGEVGTVEMGDNVWVCAGAFLLPNTTIGAGSVVGAAAVVEGAFPERSLIAGNPAKLVRRL